MTSVLRAQRHLGAALLAAATLFGVFGQGSSIVGVREAEAQQRQTARQAVIVNRTRETLNFLYMAPIGELAWGDDRLGSDTIAAGRRYTVQLDAAGQCRYDLRAVYESGLEETRLNLNLCQTREVTLNGRSQTASEVPASSAQIGLYLVRNQSDNVVQTLRVVPAGSGNEGEDELGATVIQPGQTFTGRFDRQSQCAYDLVYTIDDNNQPPVRMTVDFCRAPIVVIDATTAQAPQAQAPAGPGGPGGPAAPVAPQATPSGPRGGPGGGSATPGGASPQAPQQAVPAQPTPPAGPGGPSRSAEVSDVTIVNAGRVTIQVINISSSRQNDWGPDRLGADVLPAGQRRTFRIERDGQCNFDIRVQFESGGEDRRMSQDICRTSEFTFTAPTQQQQRPGQRPPGGAQAQRDGRGQPKGPPPGTQTEADPTQVSEVVIFNRSNTVIEVVNISSSRVTDWGPDLLGAGTIPAGQRHTFRVQRDGQCDFDIRVQYQGGREDRRMRQNICENREYAFAGPNNRLVEGGGPADGRLVTFVNEGPTEIMELYVSPSADTHWLNDRLGQNTLPRRVRLELRLAQADGCEFDLRVVYRGGANEERRGVNLCNETTVRLARRHTPGSLVSTGTGFYVTAQGHVVTNNHVIDGCTTVGIHRPNGERITLRVIATDEETDLALLQQDNATTPFAAFRSNASQPLRAGDRVVLIGYPARQELGDYNITEGLVSALRGHRGDSRNFQYTAPTQPGNSGGPVLDEGGLVVGVVVAQLTGFGGQRPAQNINFGIRPEVVRQFLLRNNVTPTDEDARPARRPNEILPAALPTVLPLDCVG